MLSCHRNAEVCLGWQPFCTIRQDVLPDMPRLRVVPAVHNSYAQCRATADGEAFEDTHARNKPIVFLYGGRPFTGGLCKGVEEAMASMRAGQFCHMLIHLRMS